MKRHVIRLMCPNKRRAMYITNRSGRYTRTHRELTRHSDGWKPACHFVGFFDLAAVYFRSLASLDAHPNERSSIQLDPQELDWTFKHPAIVPAAKSCIPKCIPTRYTNGMHTDLQSIQCIEYTAIICPSIGQLTYAFTSLLSHLYSSLPSRRCSSFTCSPIHRIASSYSRTECKRTIACPDYTGGNVATKFLSSPGRTEANNKTENQ